jgi:putative glutamine amidotransferase
MQPIIGMLAEIDDEKKTAIHHAYVFAIENSGGLPLLFPYIENEQIIDRFTELCDGFLFTGGMDIAPKYYNEKQSPFCGTSQSFRDKFEFRVIKKVLATKKPILCICRGAQLLNVALGGSLYQDIPNERPSNISTSLPGGCFQYGIIPEVEIEIFILRKTALTIGADSPIYFTSPLRKIRPRLKAGIRVNI